MRPSWSWKEFMRDVTEEIYCKPNNPPYMCAFVLEIEASSR